MKKELNWIKAVGTYLIMLVLMLLVAAPAQAAWGIIGLAVTELMLLAIALGAAAAFRADFKTTFPLTLPPIKSFFGGLLMYFGTYSLVAAVEFITLIIFPQAYEFTDTMTSITEGVTPLAAMIIIAVLPAICEETLFRGFYLSCLRKFPPAAAVAIVGVAFGVFHLDPYRFLTTALLGTFLAFLAYQTRSMILPMIFHLLTNIASVVALYLPAATTEESEALAQDVEKITGSVPVAIGMTLFYTGIAVILIWCGLRLIGTLRKNPVVKAIVIISGMALIFAGYILVAYGASGIVGDLTSLSGSAAILLLR